MSKTPDNQTLLLPRPDLSESSGEDATDSAIWRQITAVEPVQGDYIHDAETALKVLEDDDPNTVVGRGAKYANAPLADRDVFCSRGDISVEEPTLHFTPRASTKKATPSEVESFEEADTHYLDDRPRLTDHALQAFCDSASQYP